MRIVSDGKETCVWISLSLVHRYKTFTLSLNDRVIKT